MEQALQAKEDETNAMVGDADQDDQFYAVVAVL